MTKYERIRQMRLAHAAGCTEPPVKESRVKIETMSKRMERDLVIGDGERFTYNHPEKQQGPN